MNTFRYPYNDFTNVIRNKNGMNPYYRPLGFIPDRNEPHDSNEHKEELILPLCR